MDNSSAEKREDLLKILDGSEVYKLLAPETQAKLVDSIKTGSEEQFSKIRDKFLEYEDTLVKAKVELNVFHAEQQKRADKEVLKQNEEKDKKEAELMAQKLLEELAAMK